MHNENETSKNTIKLQAKYWPPIPAFNPLVSDLSQMLDGKNDWLRTLENIDIKKFTAKDLTRLHNFLGEVYSYIYGYQDSFCFQKLKDEEEIKLHQLKIKSERILLNYLEFQQINFGFEIKEKYSIGDLTNWVSNNKGWEHPLFAYIRDQASPLAMSFFLMCDTMRNEIVDDEIALLLCGLQGNLKKTVAQNLWDECGRGRLESFHTFWLRRLLDRAGLWNEILEIRKEGSPWFNKIISNTFNMLLTRPGNKLKAYGCFMNSEAWVKPHFEKILQGLNRLGMNHDDIAIYYRAHIEIDPRHSEDLLEAISEQSPILNQEEITQIVEGTYLGTAAALQQYDQMLSQLKRIDLRSKKL